MMRSPCRARCGARGVNLRQERIPTLTPGQLLAHYRIERLIGQGGMGEVYLAEDTRLNRKVALKFLSPQLAADPVARMRLFREARAAARIDHPNICSVHEIVEEQGRPFIVMQWVDGETLAARLGRGPLELKEALDVAMCVADAVSQAHVQGIIHRDIKPQNIMIGARGLVKVMDFGLAKSIVEDPLAATAEDTQTVLTRPSAIPGTVPYMSPEQLRGEPIDARSDIFSFGSMLYEMISGRRPFVSTTAAAIASEILTSEPLPLSGHVPEELQRIVGRCLEKNKTQRYPAMRDAAIDLDNCRRAIFTSGAGAAGGFSSSHAVRRGGFPFSRRALVAGAMLALALTLAASLILPRRGAIPSGPRPIDSLAVLPLKDLSANPAQEYFADGMTESLIAEISRIGTLRVISRTSAMQYKNTDKLMPQVARELNVDGVLEGSIARQGDQVRISVQLIDGSTDGHIWNESYLRSSTDILGLQSDVARAVADALRVQLTAQEAARLSHAPAVDPEAHDAYLRGRYYWNEGARENLPKSLEFFELALKKDPSYAPAYAGIADYYSSLPFFSNLQPDDVFPKARESVARALELDGSLAEAHGTLAYILAYYDWNWKGAEAEFQTSLKLNPNDATQRHRYSRYLASVGRMEDALRELERARLLDPLDPLIRANVGVIHYFARQYDRAIEDLENLLRDQPDFSTAHWGLGLAYEQKGSYDRAATEFETANARRGINSLASLGHLYGTMGQKAKAEQILAELRERATRENVSGYQMALVHLGLRETGPALEALERAYRERSTLLSYIKMDPRLDPLRHDPAFEKLLARVGLGS
jgi:eukaryotic-like serine/threonine-protein kinase